MQTLVLFEVPATGHVISKRKPASVDRIKVNHKLAKQRYYFHRRLKKLCPDYPVDAAKRTIELPFASFDEMPVGDARYYVGRLLKLGYTVQLEIYGNNK